MGKRSKSILQLLYRTLNQNDLYSQKAISLTMLWLAHNSFDEKKDFEMGIVFEMKSGKIKVHSRMLVTKRAPNIRKTGLYQIMRIDMVW